MPTYKQIKRWQQYLANERAEAAVYRELAKRKEGEEREILLSLAEAEQRHEEYWRTLLGNDVGMPRSPGFSTRLLGFMARHFGNVFVLAMMQTAEQRNPYETDADATAQMRADEAIHAEIVRGLAAQGREKMSGNFRAAIFGANDGLVSNLALVLGVIGSGLGTNIIVLTGISGLLAGALSMAAGEYISVKSQEELLDASTPHPKTKEKVPALDVNANELALVYRARGMSESEAGAYAAQMFAELAAHQGINDQNFIGSLDFDDSVAEVEENGAIQAAISSFLCFALGAFVPIFPFLFGLSVITASIIALIIVGLVLMITGSITGILSGKPPLKRALRQLVIGLAAAAVTYGLGSLFGVAIT